MGSATLVWDASALAAAARIDRLDVLSDLARLWRNVTTKAVVSELTNIGLSLGNWPEIEAVDDLTVLQAVVSWAQRVGGFTSGHNRGEATVFAWAEVHTAIPMIDDQQAAAIARRHGLQTHGTLWLFAEAIIDGRETEQSLCGVIDSLLNGRARYPFESGRHFPAWARDHKLLP